jgi:NAD(P)-dependent dehydrogenase (short-subunit alcohol dehydrogenase family)
MTTDGTGSTRSVVITGASTGIGEACALHLDGLGWRVFAGVRRDADGEALQRKASARLMPVRIDVTDQASIASACDAVAREVGERGLDGLVNNAGIAVAAPLEFLPIEDLRRQLEVNVVGQITVTQAFLPLIRKARGRIVNIGSVSGKLATPFAGPYSGSKFAMEALTDALRIELRPWKIEVAIMEPGSIATPIWEKATADADVMEAKLPAEAAALYGAAIRALRIFADETAKRGIPAAEVAKAVAHALTARKPKTRYIVGTDARLQAVLAKFVPDRLRDGLIARQLKLPKKA